ncbi:MAG: hypothetical protein L0Y71_25225 [Gemmataceae bacterium]|nr:hypothetical protein [Gemmataceae bacterium]
MPSIRTWAGAFASALLLTSAASAQYVPATGQYHSPVTKKPLGVAPDAFGPGFYVWCPDGQTIGPNYWLRPCFEPYNGIRPPVYRIQGGRPEFGPAQPTPGYPYHPYARGPRDFFMFRENMEAEQGRQALPNLLP